MDEALVLQAGNLIHQAQHIGLVSHIRPDGDAVGSLLGLGLALEETGKTVQMVLVDGLPASMRYLPAAGQVAKKFEALPELMISLDCADRDRLGDGLADISVDINIDHHITNLNFAGINLVDADAVATAAMLAVYIPAWGIPLRGPAASALLNGLITDTLGFRTSNMTPRAMRIAADLMECGADLPGLYSHALMRRKFEAVRFWGVGLMNLQRWDGLIWTAVSQAERKGAGYPGQDDADLINLLTTINDQKIIVIFVEQPLGGVKVSWRAAPGYDVSKIAVRFGGGGHPAAAGATLPGGLDEVQLVVLEATRSLLAVEDREKQKKTEVST